MSGPTETRDPGLGSSAAERQSPILEHLRTVFARDLATLRTEVELYPADGLLWQAIPGCPNPGGNLVLHLVGNLRHFVGAQLGGTGYVRDREAEFSATGFSREQLLAGIESASTEVARTLAALDPAVLSEPFPLPSHQRSVVTGLWLVHLSTHLAFHLGQLDYHRRAVSGDAQGAGAVSLAPLFQR
jgi:hypothetical protein